MKYLVFMSYNLFLDGSFNASETEQSLKKYYK